MAKKKFTAETEEEWEASLPPLPPLALATGPKTLTNWLVEYFTTHSSLLFERFEETDDRIPLRLRLARWQRELMSLSEDEFWRLPADERLSLGQRLQQELPGDERVVQAVDEDGREMWMHTGSVSAVHGRVDVRVTLKGDDRVEVRRVDNNQPVFVLAAKLHNNSIVWLCFEHVDYDFLGELDSLKAEALEKWLRVDVSNKPQRGPYEPDPEGVVRRFTEFRALQRATNSRKSEEDILYDFCHKHGHGARSVKKYIADLRRVGRWDEKQKVVRPPDP